jgi:tRNA A-37 threonylcarbamoyl transferase component Bud32
MCVSQRPRPLPESRNSLIIMQRALQAPANPAIERQPTGSAFGGYRRSAGNDFTAISVVAIDDETLTNIAASPERLLSDPAATLVKLGRSARVVRVDLLHSGLQTPVAYKRCGSRTPIRRMVRGLRTSAAVRNFHLGHRLASLGIATPRPLLAVAPRWHNLLSPSYLATEWIEGAVPIDAFARAATEWAPARRRAALREAAAWLGRLVGRLHKCGYSHRDLKSANLLVRERDRHIETFLVDLDGATHPLLLSERARLKNLGRLHEATCQMSGVTSALRCRFLHAYLAAFGQPASWKTLWRQMQKARRIPPLPAAVRGAG